MMKDIGIIAPDHIVVSGDLTNIALPDEFAASRVWLEQVGNPHDVTVIPGNHDAYIKVPFDLGIGQWTPWMLGDDETEVSFPFVRRRGPVVFIMLTTANPTPPLSASGTLGKQQLAKLEVFLNAWRGKDVFRVVVLHHPPEDYPTKPRKALRDRAAFRDVMSRTGAELVLHGHQHHSHFGLINGPHGKIPVLGVPSASMVLEPKKGDEARWNLINVAREDACWRLSTHARGLTEQGFETIGRWNLQIPLT